MNKESQNNITEMYNKFATVEEIANKTNIKQNEIKIFIDKNKLRKQRDDYYRNILNIFVIKNFTRKEIAEATNLSPKKISYLCNKYKITKSFREIKKQVLDDKIIKEYKNKAVSISEMAKKLNMSYSCVKYVYRRNGLENVHSTRYKKFEKLDEEKYQNILYELKNTKLSLEKIGNKYNISRQRVYQIQKANKIKR